MSENKHFEPVTYYLRTGGKDSRQFYSDVSDFADEVLSQADNLSKPVVEAFGNYISLSGKERPRSFQEYTLEFLTLGVLWQVYSGDALGLAAVTGKMLSGLSSLRRKGGLLKPGLSYLKGILSTAFLSPDLYDNTACADPSLEQYKKLLCWLEASGEFVQETKRLTAWKEYFEKLDDAVASDCLATSIIFAIWFSVRSEAALGRYTRNVDAYLEKIRPQRYWREDVIFCGRRRVEYHLNMVGAEIMNRAFREGFLKTEEKLLAVPGCMRKAGSQDCAAEASPEGLYCKGCSADCRAGSLKKLGERLGFGVLIVPHESSLSEKTRSGLLGKKAGIIGVACVLNLLSGGWKLREMELEVQCVILDYCGCKTHWHEEGVMTDIDEARLAEVLGK